MNQDQVKYLKDMADAKGCITPDDVVAEAKQKSSPLHDLFEWDVRKAAREHWLDRARELIRYVSVEVISTEPARIDVVPAFVRDPRVDNGKQGYVLLTKARDDLEVARMVMLNELRAVNAALERASRVAVALESEEAVREMIERVGRFRQDIQHRFPPAAV